MCYACLFRFRWEPERFMSLSKPHKAFVAAAIDVYAEQQDKAKKGLKVKPRRL